MKQTETIDPDTIKTQAASGATIPFWNYSVVSPLDGQTYQGTMVGRSPFFNGHRTTVVNTDLIPVIIKFEDTATVFDPTLKAFAMVRVLPAFTVSFPLLVKPLASGTMSLRMEGAT
jgi:hypothetical protein